MALSFKSIRVSIWPDIGWRIQWVLQNAGEAGHTVQVDRASGPEGPWTTVKTGLALDDVTFEDRVLSYRAFWDVLWYRLRVVNGALEDVLVSPSVSVGEKADRIAKEIIRQHELLLYGVNSHPGYYARDVACFKRTKYGEPCRHCSDEYTGEVLIPRCKVCSGSRYIEGYANPILFRARIITPTSKNMEITELGEQNSDIRNWFMAAYPMLEPGDILAEKTNGNHWRVDALEVSEPGGILVSQRITTSRIHREDIANSLIYPE